MKNIPKEIYLNLGIPKRVMNIDERDDISFNDLNGVSWSTDKIDDQDLKFVLSGVSQQRELLIAYEKNHYTPQEWALASKQCIEDIDNFLAINYG